MPRDCHCVGGSQRLTACDVGDVDAGEIHGHALSRDASPCDLPCT
jgi:hypothetical protein